MNRFGNYCYSYEDYAYHYDNADGSKFFSNTDGSAFYDPGDSGKGKKWYRSPNGVKHYISSDGELEENYEDDSDDRSTQYMGSPEPSRMNCSSWSN
jgi:hypothetical protein